MDCELIREKINTLKSWPSNPDSADKAFLSGVARDLEQLLESHEKAVNIFCDLIEGKRFDLPFTELEKEIKTIRLGKQPIGE